MSFYCQVSTNEELERALNATSDKPDGTVLRLYICKRTTNATERSPLLKRRAMDHAFGNGYNIVLLEEPYILEEALEDVLDIVDEDLDDVFDVEV